MLTEAASPRNKRDDKTSRGCPEEKRSVCSLLFSAQLAHSPSQLALSLPRVCLFLYGIKLDEILDEEKLNPPPFLICAGCSEFPCGVCRNREIKLSVRRGARWERFQRETKWRMGDNEKRNKKKKVKIQRNVVFWRITEMFHRGG